MKKNTLKILLLVLSISLGAGITYFVTKHNQHGALATHPNCTISLYDKQRDLDEILALFEHDWFMLSVREYDRERMIWMLDSGSPNEFEHRYIGKMKIAVLREHGKFVGFITYYMKNFYEGTILFLAIHQDFRGRRFGMPLLDFATCELKKMGAKVVSLVTRITNEPGIKLYNRAGFTQSQDVDPGFFRFAKDV